MAESIAQNQNTIPQLDRLAAMRHLYSTGKRVLAAQMLLTVPAVLVWSFVVLAVPPLKVWSALWGIVVSLLDALILDPFQKSSQRQAAKIQELFDCEILGLPWPELKAGTHPDPEDIAAAAKQYRRSEPELKSIINWYPKSVDQLPRRLARLICQRSNCRWDAQLRRRYGTWIIAVIVAMTVIVFAIAIAVGLTLENFVLIVLAPLSPAYLWAIREVRRQREASTKLERLKDHVQRIWRQAIVGDIAPDVLDGEARTIQDEIFAGRSANPLIFDWIFNSLRSGQEEQMNVAVVKLVDEALEKFRTRTE